ncbi:MAG: 16S rRNA (guanine(966)-N(2))-methyltransferase RsmD [Gammaproteobacteria bacterium]
MVTKTSNKLRIIGGEWRSRVIVFDDAPGLRPTPARVRETLFNWLQVDILGSRCLDLFAGSGALGFEAASRGARQVVLLENNSKTVQRLRENAVALNTERIEVLHKDASTYLDQAQGHFDLIFLDPPFGQGLVQTVCRRIAQRDLLAPYGKIYVETERQWQADNMPDGWQLLKHKVAGDVGYNLYQRQ